MTADVARAHARLQSAARRVIRVCRAPWAVIVTVDGHFAGLRQITYLGDVLVLVHPPRDAVYSLDLINLAFIESFTAVAESKRAESELFHAIGLPPPAYVASEAATAVLMRVTKSFIYAQYGALAPTDIARGLARGEAMMIGS